MQGEALGSYRIISELGRGGMGTVYLAEHTLIGRKAAVKVLLPELSRKPEIVTRFFNEARASTAIAHPGIVQAFDFGYHDNGSAYIVMELLSGESLEDRLKRLHRIPEEQAVRIARQCASALAAAHAAGIIHRDLKPGNIFLATDPEMEAGERAKILDFGIAKLTDAEEDSDFRTRTGSMMGTPVYMSPEQCRGAGAVDLRTDIYSLGCVLFRLVCGRPPFLAEGIGEIIACHLREPAPSLRSIEPGLSPQLDALVQRTLAKSPDNRFASMTELAEALRSLYRAPSVFPAGGRADTPWPPVPAAPGTLQASAPTTLGTAASQQLHVPQRSRRGALLIASAAGLVAGGLVLFLALSGGEPSSSAGTPESELALRDEPAEGSASGAGLELEPPSEAPGDEPVPVVPIMVTIQSTPGGASVHWPGEEEPLGETPYELVTPPRSGQISLELRMPGYQSKTISFAGDRDDQVEVDLDLEPRPRSRSRSRKTTPKSIYDDALLNR